MENVLMVLDMAMAVMGLGCILGDVIVILKKFEKVEQRRRQRYFAFILCITQIPRLIVSIYLKDTLRLITVCIMFIMWGVLWYFYNEQYRQLKYHNQYSAK